MSLSAFDPNDVATEVKPNGVVVRDFPNGIRTKSAPDGRTVATMKAEDGSTRVIGKPRIKRSRAVALVAMGLATMVVAACDAPDEMVNVYSGPAAIEQCIAAATTSPDYCKQAYEAAMRQHEETAPVYETLAQCEAEHGQGFCDEKAAPAVPVSEAAATGGAACATPPGGAEPASLNTLQAQDQGPDTKECAPAAEASQGGTTAVYHGGGSSHTGGGHSFFTPYMMGYMMGSNNSATVTPQPLYRHAASGNLVTPSKYVFPVAAPIKSGPISVPASTPAAHAVAVPGKSMIPNSGNASAFTVSPSQVHASPSTRTVVGSVPSVRAGGGHIGSVGHSVGHGVAA